MVLVPDKDGTLSADTFGCDSIGAFAGHDYTGSWKSQRDKKTETVNAVTANVDFSNGITDSVMKSLKATQVTTRKVQEEGQWKVVHQTVITITAKDIPVDKASPLLHLGMNVDEIAQNPALMARLAGRYLPLVYQIKGPATQQHATLTAQYTDLESGETTSITKLTSDDKSEVSVMFMFQ